MVQYFYIVAVGFALIVSELIWREFPVAYNNQRFVGGVFAYIFGCSLLHVAHGKQTGNSKYEYLFCHDQYVSVLATFQFYQFTRYREPYHRALAFGRF